MAYLGWIGNAFLLAGLWLAGDRWPYAYALTILGEAIWSVKVARMRQWDMLFLSVVFILLAARNLYLWTDTP